MNVLGKISRSSLLSVVFPLEEQPLTPTTTAFRGVAIVAEMAVLDDDGKGRSFDEMEIVSPEKRPILASVSLTSPFRLNTDETGRGEILKLSVEILSSSI
jgi:hypothetical protein